MRTTEEKNRLDRIAHAVSAAPNTATATPAPNPVGDTLLVQRNRASSPAVIHISIGPSRTVMPTSTLSQLLPPLTFLRSADNSGLRPIVNAKPETSEIPSRTHALDQSRRPAAPKRHAAVIA